MPVQHQLASIGMMKTMLKKTVSSIVQNLPIWARPFIAITKTGCWFLLKVDNDETFAKMLMEKAQFYRVAIYLVILSKATQECTHGFSGRFSTMWRSG